MLVKCDSCGAPVEKTDQYNYCAKCERERNDPQVVPLVWEYIGGTLGALPNKRGDIKYSLKQMGFIHVGEYENLPLYQRENDGTPMGLLALILLDGKVLIVEGDYDLNSLFLYHPEFAKDPVTYKLPRQIQTLHPEHFETVQRLKRAARLE